MKERTIHLKIKVQTLVDEAKTIRREANKTRGMVKWRLNEHRTGIVRSHARLNLLAYGILIGTPYSAMEKNGRHEVDLEAVGEIAKRFGATEKMIDVWREDANGYVLRGRKAA